MLRSLIFLKRHWSFCVLLFLFTALPPGAGADIKKIEQKVSNSLETEIKTQKINKDWEQERNILKNQYDQLSYNNKNLKKHLNKLEKILSFQQDKNSEFLRKQKEVQRIKTELDSLLTSLILDMEEFIKKDLPFHQQERLSRIAALKDQLMVNQSDPAEKYRQVFEVLQIETDFGRNVEVYKNSIELQGEEKLVEILRVGRLSMFFLTPDKKTAGKFDPLKKQWITVSSKVKKEIEKGILTAKGERTAELVKLPFGRIAR